MILPLFCSCLSHYCARGIGTPVILPIEFSISLCYNSRRQVFGKGETMMAQRERKLTEKELKRKENFEKLCSEIEQNGYIYRLLFFPLPELPFVPPRSRRTSASPGAGLLPGPPPFGCSFTISMERLSGRSIFFTKGPVILPVTLALSISSVDLDLSGNRKGGTLVHDADPLTIVDEIFRHDLLFATRRAVKKSFPISRSLFTGPPSRTWSRRLSHTFPTPPARPRRSPAAASPVPGPDRPSHIATPRISTRQPR